MPSPPCRALSIVKIPTCLTTKKIRYLSAVTEFITGREKDTCPSDTNAGATGYSTGQAKNQMGVARMDIYDSELACKLAAAATLLSGVCPGVYLQAVCYFRLNGDGVVERRAIWKIPSTSFETGTFVRQTLSVVEKIDDERQIFP